MTRNELVSLTIEGRQTPAYIAMPDGAGPHPAVVVIQEWWGLNDHIKQIAERFADEGFAAIAPDLYYGAVATEPDEARKLAMAADWTNALAVIQTAIDTLLAHDEVQPKRVGMTGFCMGGGLAWHGAAKLQHIAASVPFYGGGPDMSDAEVAQIRCPILAFYGELDQGVPPSKAAARAAQMDKTGVRYENIIYPNAHHAFFNDTRPHQYSAEASADAWARMLALFREVLADGS